MQNGLSREYKQKVISVCALSDILKPGMKVYLEQGPAEPLAIVKGLMSQVDCLQEIKLLIIPVPNVNRIPFGASPYTDHWEIYTLFGNHSLQQAIARGRVNYVPIHVSEIPMAFQERLRPEVALIQVSPPDATGLCSLGPAVDYNKAAMQVASTVIAQVNHRMPFTCGDTGVHLSEIDYLIEEDTELIQIPPTEPGEVEKQIASYVADLVPDGSTIQIGIGRIPDTILTMLAGKRDLGIHSGLLSDRMINLIETGVATGGKKQINRHEAVATMLIGTDRLYNYCDRNPLVKLYPATYTHNRSVISQLDNFIAINSAIEIDLTGQVNCEVVKNELIAGIGGQVDYTRIARLSQGGKSILAISSLAKDKSKIVSQLKEVPVSVSRTEADYIVTEFGVAELRYRSLRERAGALARIAHPSVREELHYWANKLY